MRIAIAALVLAGVAWRGTGQSGARAADRHGLTHIGRELRLGCHGRGQAFAQDRAPQMRLEVQALLPSLPVPLLEVLLPIRRAAFLRPALAGSSGCNKR